MHKLPSLASRSQSQRSGCVQRRDNRSLAFREPTPLSRTAGRQFLGFAYVPAERYWRRFLSNGPELPFRSVNELTETIAEIG